MLSHTPRYVTDHTIQLDLIKKSDMENDRRPTAFHCKTLCKVMAQRKGEAVRRRLDPHLYLEEGNGEL